MIKKNFGNKYDSINFEKYKLPNFHKMVHAENVFSTIEQWPSKSRSRNTPIDHILLQKKRLVVLDEPHSKMSKNVPQPRFLTHLEEYVRDQFKKHEIKGNERNPVRLQVYREVFDWIIEAFKTYQPLLSKIKREYELNLSFFGDEIRRLEPMKEVLWTIAEDRDQQVLKIKRKENSDNIHLKEENLRLSQKLSEYEANNETLNGEVKKLSDDLGHEHLAYRNEADSKKLLIMDLNEMKAHLDDISLIKIESDHLDQEDAVMLRYALEEAKKAQAKAIKECSDMKAVFADVVPVIKFQRLHGRYDQLLSEQKIVMEKLLFSEKSLRTLDEKYNAIIKQRDFYYLKYMEQTQSPANIAQSWDKVSEFVSGGAEKWQEVANKEKDVAGIANIIFEDIKDKEDIKVTKRHVSLAKQDSEKSSNEDKDETSNLYSKSVNKRGTVSESENKAVMRTMIEMMCGLPPGTINLNFDPVNLLNILNREKAKRDNSIKEGKHWKKKQSEG